MSRLDDAFLKAYAKVRGNHVSRTGRSGSELHGASVPDAIDASNGDSNAPESAEGEIWIDANGERHFRPDDGVANVASFIARTSNGRVRGSAPRPGDGASIDGFHGDGVGPRGMLVPAGSHREDYMVDEVHAMRGPHFQPIALDLNAFDLIAPTGSESQGSREGRSHQGTPFAAEIASPSRPAVTYYRRPETGNAGPSTAQGTASKPGMERSLRGADEGAIMRADVSHPGVPNSGLNRHSHVSGAAAPVAAAMAQRLHAQAAAESVESRIHFDLHEEEIVTAHSTVNEETTVSFQPAWEVDRFEFADIVWELSDETSPLWLAAEQLQTACQEGLKIMAITSPGSEQGRSTLSIVLARMLAASGLNVLLLDGDMERPSLADKLSLDVQMGWSDAIRTGISPEEVAVHSVEDGFTVLPLAVTNTAVGTRQFSALATRMVGELRLAFDLIIIDATQMNMSGGWIPGTEETGLIDAALVIQDLRQENPAAMQACLQRLSELGIENVGLVENFSGS